MKNCLIPVTVSLSGRETVRPRAIGGQWRDALTHSLLLGLRRKEADGYPESMTLGHPFSVRQSETFSSFFLTPRIPSCQCGLKN